MLNYQRVVRLNKVQNPCPPIFSTDLETMVYWESSWNFHIIGTRQGVGNDREIALFLER